MFTARVADSIRRRQLLESGDRVVVAVSGGADSMALLEVLAELRVRLGLWLCVAHLNHRLRGEEAEADARFVAARGGELGLPVRVEAADVGAERRRAGGSLEAVARRVRYGFLERVARDVGASKVALGHTADDQVETILEGLLRGGELGALCGMPVRRPLCAERTPGAFFAAEVVRPLLEVWREDVLAYLGERGVAFRTDATNADLAFARNAIRHEVLPLLEARLGGGVRGMLLRLAERAGCLSAAVAREAEALVAGEDGAASLEVEALASAPRLVRRAALRRAAERAGGGGELRRRALDAVEGLLGGGSGREVAVGGGVVARRVYGELRIERAGRSPAAVCVGLEVPGRAEVPEVGLWVEAERLEGREAPLRPEDPWDEVVDLERVGERLEVRTRRPGDRFRPLGLAGSKKLKDFLIDERVPRGERGRTLVVTGREGIAWVVGRRLDARAKVTPATRRVARLRAGPLASHEAAEPQMEG